MFLHLFFLFFMIWFYFLRVKAAGIILCVWNHSSYFPFAAHKRLERQTGHGRHAEQSRGHFLSNQRIRSSVWQRQAHSRHASFTNPNVLRQPRAIALRRQHRIEQQHAALLLCWQRPDQPWWGSLRKIDKFQLFIVI